MTREDIDMQRVIMLNMDDHLRPAALDHLPGFTPACGRSAKVPDELNERAQRIAKRRRSGPLSWRLTNRWPANCHCRPSPICSASRRKTA